MAIELPPGDFLAAAFDKDGAIRAPIIAAIDVASSALLNAIVETCMARIVGGEPSRLRLSGVARTFPKRRVGYAMKSAPRSTQESDASPSLEVLLLGVPEVRFGGKLLGSRPCDASLLAYLLLNRAEALPRDSVAFTLLPDVPEPLARSRLRSRLHRLISSGLPASRIPWIVSSSQKIRWNPDAKVMLDVEEFERLATRDDMLMDALALYRGDLLAGFDDEWLEQPRTRLNDIYLKTLLRAAAHAENVGQFEDAIRCSEILLRNDPWNEAAVRILVRLWSATGDRGRAIQAYRDFVQRLTDDLGVAPSPETAALYEQISSGQSISASVPVGASSLTPIYGRDGEIESTIRLLGSRRLVTLTGPGGVGKSRIAREVQVRVAPRFRGGIYNIEFAFLTMPDMVLPHVAASLGVAHVPDRATLDTLATVTSDEPFLVGFANVEHLLQPVAEIAEQLLIRCKAATILATSREPLRVPGEWVEVVRPLPLAHDDSVDDRQRFCQEPAVRLFLERAMEVSPAFREHDLNRIQRAAVVEIVRKLDGIPLAIELAASRTNVVPVDTLAAHLDQRFALLTRASRTAHPRQQSLRATIDWSYDLLTPDERRTFMLSGVFTGSWTPEAGADVCFEGQKSLVEVIALVSSLVEKSLVTLERDASLRYRLLETLKAYANEHLEPEQRHQLLSRHAAFFAALATKYADADPEERPATPIICADWANFRAALEWALYYGNNYDVGTRLLYALRRLPELHDNPELKVWLPYEVATDSVR